VSHTPPRTLRDIGEFGLIDRIKTWTAKDDSDILLHGAGDDTAVILLDENRVQLATCDVMIEGKHFSRDGRSLESLGRRIASINISDIAAMGGSPKWALFSIMGPPELPIRDIEELYCGLLERFSQFGVQLAGGNTAQSPQLILDLFMTGEAQKTQLPFRSNLAAGDDIYVTGTLGDSSAGLLLEKGDRNLKRLFGELIVRHQDPTPRVNAGHAIVSMDERVAMLDISDGLESDLKRLTTDNGYGADIDLSVLPISNLLHDFSEKLGLNPRELAVAGGEDFELLFTLPADVKKSKIADLQKQIQLPVTKIGRVTEKPAIRFLDETGSEWSPPDGWDHFRE
jgi:thiamine-monophosphate kinase